ncbi:hypothetical protein A6770_28555 [Nostoc minutum NIES-26]|uniref:Uncharacterized protein n=1 Tax=Nostoc minutum NIES-26 TaxID=1844469 RepID=A0A367QKN5_9NOSO|nr:Ycf66 family protein [Dendronalium sp. ChiSLP03b]MDZ8207545.1 Ycf66 family protein [Dendronalium sp. ChiSLP03b]RCJ24320.1 hypothetical protein A6770_28555 [Nostoc minutum NIES-26]
MFNNPLNLIGIILIVIALLLCTLPWVRPQSFRRQDIILIAVFLICGSILLSQKRWYNKELTQFNLILLTLPTVFYTFENITLRNRNNQR